MAMAMRSECKHFEARTYANGETVRKCDLDLAPDAPWRCPEHCDRYERRLADAGWVYGSLATPAPPEEPPGLDDGSAAAVLDAAEDVLNSIGPGVIAEMSLEPERRASSRARKRWFRRRDRDSSGE
jgi:hypothetical protein